MNVYMFLPVSAVSNIFNIVSTISTIVSVSAPSVVAKHVLKTSHRIQLIEMMVCGCSCLSLHCLLRGSPTSRPMAMRWPWHLIEKNGYSGKKEINSSLTAHREAVLQCCCTGHTPLIDLHCRLHRLGEDMASFPGFHCLKLSIILG